LSGGVGGELTNYKVLPFSPAPRFFKQYLESVSDRPGDLSAALDHWLCNLWKAEFSSQLTVRNHLKSR
jgi:hypothetical protein